MAPSFAIRVNENNTFRYSAAMSDDQGSLIGSNDVTTLTCTLYDQDTGTIINGRNNQNILNVNGWILSTASDPDLIWRSVPADNPIIDDSKETEVHIALIKWTYGPGAIYEGTKEILIRVVNFERIP